MDLHGNTKGYQLYFPHNKLKDVIFSFEFDIYGSDLFILESVKFIHQLLFCFEKLFFLLLSFVLLLLLKIFDKVLIIEKT